MKFRWQDAGGPTREPEGGLHGAGLHATIEFIYVNDEIEIDAADVILFKSLC